jgi:hypothetical protein
MHHLEAPSKREVAGAYRCSKILVVSFGCERWLMKSAEEGVPLSRANYFGGLLWRVSLQFILKRP